MHRDGCGMLAKSAYPSRHLVPSPIVGLACAPIVETRCLKLAMSLLDFSPRIPLGTFSILLFILKLDIVHSTFCLLYGEFYKASVSSNTIIFTKFTSRLMKRFIIL